LIEVKMEEFKVCEKETKTKAFSKEGLAREERLNPREVEKEEKRLFILSVVERIEGVVESLEADVEKMSNTKAKGKQKELVTISFSLPLWLASHPLLSSQMDKLEARIATNRWHITNLELIHRLLDNDSLEPSKLDAIKEDLEYYLEVGLLSSLSHPTPASLSSVYRW
jgi:CCR4-NOT transcription complex subunit 3